MPDGGVLAARVEPLQDDQQGVALVGIQQMLEFAKPGQSFGVRFVIALLPEGIAGVAVLQAQLASRPDDAVFGKVHLLSFAWVDEGAEIESGAFSWSRVDLTCPYRHWGRIT